VWLRQATAAVNLTQRLSDKPAYGCLTGFAADVIVPYPVSEFLIPTVFSSRQYIHPGNASAVCLAPAQADVMSMFVGV